MQWLRDLEVENKRVLLRADLNVPLDRGRIGSDFRVKAVLSTIEYLLEHRAKVILLAHLGRPRGETNDKSLEAIGRRLSKLLHQDVVFVSDCVGAEAKKKTSQLKAGQIALLENLRFHHGETENDPAFAAQLAELGDLYVNDAFGVCHRAHASIVGLPRLLPSAAGLLLEKEVKMLGNVLDDPRRPLVTIIGGVKISTKIQVIEHFLESADQVVLGGALANTIISAKGLAIGRSVVEEEIVDRVKQLNLANTHLHIPVDVLASTDTTGKQPVRVAPVGKMAEHEMILDIGPDTVNLFGQVIREARTVVWGGPMGLFEVDAFKQGSYGVAQAIAQGNNFSVVGGGDTIACLAELSLMDKIDHISSGGGAMLKFLSRGGMPGLDALK